MSRKLIALALVLGCSSAWGQEGQVVSYYVSNPNPQTWLQFGPGQLERLRVVSSPHVC